VVPALQTWFAPLTPNDENGPKKLALHHFDSHWETNVPLERTIKGNKEEYTFERLDSLLGHFTQWTSKKLENPSIFEPNTCLYLAQCDLFALPKVLRDDLPAPHIVQKAGKGDIYASSLWMGIPPTDTPLHKDPNPNVLLQLAGRKTIRVLPPQSGRAVYANARRLCDEAEGSGLTLGPSIRGEEMMVGLERAILNDFMWGEGNCTEISENQVERTDLQGFETTLAAGDGVFIPKSWWHSVRGIGDHSDGINASVSWMRAEWSECACRLHALTR
jgi:hypothetical protein